MPIDAGLEAEFWVLTTAPGRALLAEVGTVPRPLPADLERWGKRASPDRVAAAVRLAVCRRRAGPKFERAGAMWLEPTGLEQATAGPVARHKARRFAGADLVIDLCSGIGGDAVAIAGGARVIAVDLDPAMAHRSRWNAEVYGVADKLISVRGRGERFGWPSEALVHVDPDRRAGSATQARSVRDYAPGLPFLRSLPRMARGGALKLGPASDFESQFSLGAFESEVISLAGECKEATLWFGDLATCRRRATRLPEGATWTDRDGPDVAAELAEVAGWVFSPDPALVRSRLLDSFAKAHGLARIGPGVDILTAEAPAASPFLTAFRVEAILPVDLKRLRHEVAARRLGPLEIKVRGLDLRPESVRARLRPEGPIPATLLLIGGRGPARAILASRPPTLP